MTRKQFHRIVWILCVVSFAAGLYIGPQVNAELGAALWGLSAVLALVPFLSHRNHLR